VSLGFLSDHQSWRSATVAGRLVAGGLQLPVIAAALGAIGVIALYSAAGGAMEPYAMSHLMRLMIGIALMLLLALVPSRSWVLLAAPLYVVALAMLAAVPWLGMTISGSQRWLTLGPVTLQPAEIMKLGMVLLLAVYYQWLPRHHVSRPLYVVLPLVSIAVPAALVLEQPDLGTAALIAATGLALMFLAGVSGLYFVSGAAGIAILAPILWSALHDYQRERVLVFLDPERDLLGAGYQVYQARIALAAGGVSGKGFLQGTQTQLDFVPENHTDFILSLIGEELGFAGSACVLLLFGILLTMLVLSSFGARGRLQRLVIMGVSVLVFLQVAINTGMVMGLLPVVGVPLPLVSFGGSTMLTTLAALGIVMSMRAEGHRDVGPSRRAAWRLTRGSP
jgi:rod shape determining protein RodA